MLADERHRPPDSAVHRAQRAMLDTERPSAYRRARTIGETNELATQPKHGSGRWTQYRPRRRHVHWTRRRSIVGSGRWALHRAAWWNVHGAWWWFINRTRRWTFGRSWRRPFNGSWRWNVHWLEALHEQYSAAASVHARVGKARTAPGGGVNQAASALLGVMVAARRHQDCRNLTHRWPTTSPAAREPTYTGTHWRTSTSRHQFLCS